MYLWVPSYSVGAPIPSGERPIGPAMVSRAGGLTGALYWISGNNAAPNREYDMSKLAWKAKGKSSGGTPKYEANNVVDGEGLRIIYYGDDPPHEITVGKAKKAASKAADDDDTMAKLAKKLGVSKAKLQAMADDDD